jgi:hypothetical protein
MILKHSAYQNLLNQQLPMAAMLLMDKDKIENICREDLTNMISGMLTTTIDGCTMVNRHRVIVIADMTL